LLSIKGLWKPKPCKSHQLIHAADLAATLPVILKAGSLAKRSWILALVSAMLLQS
jgi:hypothetical protein